MHVCVCVAGELQHSAITPGSSLEGGGGEWEGVLGKQGGSREEQQTQRLVCSLPAGPLAPPPRPPVCGRLSQLCVCFVFYTFFFFSFKEGR